MTTTPFLGKGEEASFPSNPLDRTLDVFTLFFDCLEKIVLFFSQDKQIYLLDDPLAAVDAHVAAHLFHHCIMGLLKNKTRILCTHHTHFLSAADLLVVMEHGSVTHTGPPERILRAEQIMKSIAALPDEAANESDSKKESLEDKKEDENMDEGLVKEEEKEVGVVKLHVYKSYWLAIGHCLATSILLSLLLMQGDENSRWFISYLANYNI